MQKSEKEITKSAEALEDEGYIELSASEHNEIQKLPEDLRMKSLKAMRLGRVRKAAIAAQSSERKTLKRNKKRQKMVNASRRINRK